MKVKVYGKLNLALKVGEVEGNMHKVQMCNASINIYDLVTVVKSDLFDCDFLEIPLKDNIAVKAFNKIKEKYNIGNVKISIQKGIPYGGGLGGSSADGAAVLYCLKELFNIKDEKGINEIALSLGSDVPYMLTGGYCFVDGMGEKVTKLPYSFTLSGVYGKGRDTSLAKDVYKAYDIENVNSSNDATCVRDLIIQGDKVSTINNMFNDLHTPSKKVCKEINETEKELLKISTKTIVAGSGAGVVAIGDDFSSAQIESLKRKLFYVKEFKTVPNGIEEIG